MSEQEGRKKDGERPKRKERREMRSKRSSGRTGGGKINAPSGIARKASVWRAWRATTGLVRWSNSRGREREIERKNERASEATRERERGGREGEGERKKSGIKRE